MELIGKKNLYFVVNIDSAEGLPQHLCHNTFVTYQFKFLPDQIYQTEESSGSNRSPKFGYAQMHCIEVITKDIAQELKEGSISFQIYAYPPNMDKLPQNDGGAAIKKRITMKQQAREVYAYDEAAEAKLLGLDKG
jgi:hypothetical protein